MEYRAVGKYIKGSPQKARLVIDLIRGKKAGEALSILKFTKKRAALAVEKVLRSAIANAEQKSAHVDVDTLVVDRVKVDQGPTKHRRRVRPAPMGRAFREIRRSKHITVYLKDTRKEEEEA
jgi:large subunit ribosomal protein L22